MTEKQRLGIEIQKLCDERGITAYKLAKDLGLEKVTVWRYLRGLRHPTVENLKKIAKYFGKSVEEL